MEVQRRQTAWQQEHEELWPAICRRKELSGEEKLAWYFLSRRTRAGRERVNVWGSEIAEHQGVDSSKGNVRLKSLAAKGYIRVLERNKASGAWLVELLDPPDLAALRQAVVDRQGRLFEDQEETGEETTFRPSAEPSAESGGMRIANAPGVLQFPCSNDQRLAEGIQPPPAACVEPSTVPSTVPCAQDLTLRAPYPHPHLRLKNLDNLSSCVDGAHGTVDGTVHANQALADLNATIEARRQALEQDVERRKARDTTTAEAQRIAQPAAAIVARSEAAASPAAKQRRVDELVSVMQRRVLRGPRAGTLYPEYCVYVAWCIVDELVVERLLHEVLTTLDKTDRENRLQRTRAEYFVGACKKILIDHGLSPTKPKTGGSHARKPK